MKKILKLIISIAICQVAGLIGSIFTMPQIENWYSDLSKPWFNPPNWIFGPVWTLLFLLMGIALFLVWSEAGDNRKKIKAVSVFSIQLLLNILWSVLFFGLNSPLSSFVEIIFLWVFILITLVYFYRVSKTAGLLLLPYLFWVSFASALNFFIWKLN